MAAAWPVAGRMAGALLLMGAAGGCTPSCPGQAKQMPIPRPQQHTPCPRLPVQELATWELPWGSVNPWQVVNTTMEGGRLEFPEQLQGGGFSGLEAYQALACRCWAHDPAERPGFAEIIAVIR